MGFNSENIVQMLSIPLCTDLTDILILKISFSKDISHDWQMPCWSYPSELGAIFSIQSPVEPLFDDWVDGVWMDPFLNHQGCWHWFKGNHLKNTPFIYQHWLPFSCPNFFDYFFWFGVVFSSSFFGSFSFGILENMPYFVKHGASPLTVWLGGWPSPIQLFVPLSNPVVHRALKSFETFTKGIRFLKLGGYPKQVSSCWGEELAEQYPLIHKAGNWVPESGWEKLEKVVDLTWYIPFRSTTMVMEQSPYFQCEMTTFSKGLP